MEEKTWIVPVEWAMSGLVAVKATSAKEACRKLSEDNSDIEIPSSDYSDYIEDSFTVPDPDDEAIDMCEYLSRLYNEKSHHFYLLNDL